MWLLLFTCIFLGNPGSAVETDEQRLANKIFKTYNKKLRPILNSSEAVYVTLNPGLYSIVDTDEAVESITTLLWLRMKWNDVFLTWNSSDYDGLQELNIPVSELWYPDVFVDNTIHADRPIPDEKNFAEIKSDGTVSVSFVLLLTMHCQYHIAMFPFDIQNCTAVINSWIYGDQKMGILYKTPADLSVYNENSEWNLLSMTARHEKFIFFNSTLPYTNVYYDIVIQRKPIYYLLTFVLPCFMITTISIIGIFAPFNDEGGREEKVSMGLTTLLTMAFMLTSIADKMPKSSEGLPLLGAYIMLQIAMGAVTSLTATVVLYLNRKWISGDPIPDWILLLMRLNGQIGDSSATKAHCLPNATFNCSKTDNDHNGNIKTGNAYTEHPTIILKSITSFVGQIANHFFLTSEKESLRKEWQCATQRLDLILMIAFLAINCISTVCLLIIGYSNLQI